MSKKSKKQEREAAIKAEVARREKSRLERSPLNKEQMTTLFEFVGSNIVKFGHDDDFKYTDQWLLENGIDVLSTHKFFESEKIYRDWDVLTNGDPFSLFGGSSTRHAWMPLEKDELESLIEYLEVELEQNGCAHNMQLTETWLSNTNHDKNSVIAALFAQGGFCDCEVMYNVESDGIYA